MNRIIIAGSRDFLNYERLTQELDRFIEDENLTEIEIVSGTARGAELRSASRSHAKRSDE